MLKELMRKLYNIKAYLIILVIWSIGSYAHFKKIGVGKSLIVVLLALVGVVSLWNIHKFFISKGGKKSPRTVGLHILAILCGTIFGMVYIFIVSFIPPSVLSTLVHFPSSLLESFIQSFIGSVLCYYIFYVDYRSKLLKKIVFENEVLKQEQLKSEITALELNIIALQQQVKPHFLFNSLSILKSMVKENKAQKYLVELSKIYRYFLKFDTEPIATLQEELNFVKSYIYVLEQRFEDSLRTSINIPEELLERGIPTYTLQILVENVVQHNKISDEQPINLSIYIDEKGMLCVENDYRPKLSTDRGMGIGLANIRERYRSIGRDDIYIKNDDFIFCVVLPLL